jgi:uncharacterized repeat protein (TIGR03843 family)
MASPMFFDESGAEIHLPMDDCSDEEAHDVLRAGTVSVVGRLPWSTNGAFLVAAERDAVAFGAVYKPMQGERPLWDFPHGTLHLREIASYALSELLGWGIVPPTVLRTDLEFGVGTLQRFVAHDPEQHFFTLVSEHHERFRQFALFDVIANNTDRKGGHCLQSMQSGEIVGIDHGLTFHVDWKLRTVIWDFAGLPLSDDERNCIAAALPQFSDALGAYLSPLEIEAASLRAEELLATNAFPRPEEGPRSLPWPLI